MPTKCQKSSTLRATARRCDQPDQRSSRFHGVVLGVATPRIEYPAFQRSISQSFQSGKRTTIDPVPNFEQTGGRSGFRRSIGTRTISGMASVLEGKRIRRSRRRCGSEGSNLFGISALVRATDRHRLLGRERDLRVSTRWSRLRSRFIFKWLAGSLGEAMSAFFGNCGCARCGLPNPRAPISWSSCPARSVTSSKIFNENWIRNGFLADCKAARDVGTFYEQDSSAAAQPAADDTLKTALECLRQYEIPASVMQGRESWKRQRLRRYASVSSCGHSHQPVTVMAALSGTRAVRGDRACIQAP